MIIHFLFLIWLAICQLTFPEKSDIDSLDVAIIILTQENEFHEKVFQKKEKDILNQAKDLDYLHIEIYRSYSFLDGAIGYWTIFPFLEKLSNLKDFHWLFFCEDITEINLKNLINVFKKYNSSEETFVGYVLKDNTATIIHHFADPLSVLYPHPTAGFLLSLPLLRRIVSKLPIDDEEAYSFSIDPKYEFAKFVWDGGNGVKLQNESQFCLEKTNESCATWTEKEFPKCGPPLPSDKLHIAVKTCRKYQNDRIPVVQYTWASEANNLRIFGDTDDSSIPIIKINIENVPRGHCQKTLFIFKYYLENNIAFDWLAVVDDDTIISIPRLRELLACYNSSNNVALGERYGYGVAYGNGYDYITGGGGMIFSFPIVKELLRKCKCPSIDSPDDMIIGMCLKRSKIPVTHSPYFHQARPIDYAPDFLKPFKHISFHKHWNINPYVVYEEWLKDDTDAGFHVEL